MNDEPAPVVAPERGQNGAILACGCWTAHVLVGMKAGADAVNCPNGHGSSLIAKANVDELPSAPVVAGELTREMQTAYLEGIGGLVDAIYGIHRQNDHFPHYCVSCRTPWECPTIVALHNELARQQLRFESAAPPSEGENNE